MLLCPLDADQLDRKSTVKWPLGGHHTCLRRMENGKRSLQAGIRRLWLSPRTLCIYLSPLCGAFSLREGFVCERVTTPTLSFRHSFVDSLLSPSLNSQCTPGGFHSTAETPPPYRSRWLKFFFFFFFITFSRSLPGV